jgi:hypothetical protein
LALHIVYFHLIILRLIRGNIVLMRGIVEVQWIKHFKVSVIESLGLRILEIYVVCNCLLELKVGCCLWFSHLILVISIYSIVIVWSEIVMVLFKDVNQVFFWLHKFKMSCLLLAILISFINSREWLGLSSSARSKKVFVTLALADCLWCL